MKPSITLTNLAKGASGTVKEVIGQNRVSKRLMEMGIVPGVRLRVVKTAPFGDPIELRVRGFNLALRRSEADSVEIVEDVVEQQFEK